MTTTQNPIRDVLIVGGGTAGWLAAAFLARTLAAREPDGVRVTLVESPDIPTVGVGEGTFPSIRGTLAAIGLDERTFLRECQATFKHGIRFDDWGHAPGRNGRHSYFHPFSQPSQRPGAPDLLPYWLAGVAGPGVPLAEAVTMQARVVAEGRAPKRPGDGAWSGPLNHAFHLDAGRFATLLASHAKGLGVTHVLDTVEHVEVDGRDHVAGVVTRGHGVLTAGLYVDCTGFRATLVGAALHSPFKRVDDVLFTDRAMALQVPYPSPDAPITPCTVSTAHAAGWTWDIGLQTRRGLGVVYSSRHMGDDEAERVLRSHAGPAGDALAPRRLVMDCGWRERSWIGNCVAVGLSSGFLEPLESSGIGLVEAASYLLAYGFPHDGDLTAAARRFNAQMTARYERIVDFLKLHYALSERPEPFWREHADPSSWTDSLRDLLASWRTRPPHRLDFVTDLEMYPPSSWQYVLYGMGYRTRLAPALRAALDRAGDARREFEALRGVGARACADLPMHRELLQALCA